MASPIKFIFQNYLKKKKKKKRLLGKYAQQLERVEFLCIGRVDFNNFKTWLKIVNSGMEKKRQLAWTSR